MLNLDCVKQLPFPLILSPYKPFQIKDLTCSHTLSRIDSVQRKQTWLMWSPKAPWYCEHRCDQEWGCPPLCTLGNTLLCAADTEIKSFVGFIGCCQGRLLQMRPAMCENLGHPEEMLTLGFWDHQYLQFHLDNKPVWHFLGREVMHTDDMLNKEDIGALVLTMVISYLPSVWGHLPCCYLTLLVNLAGISHIAPVVCVSAQ